MYKSKEKIKKYTWINLSAKEALSYKTEILTRDSRERERQSRGQFKAHKRTIDCFKERNAMLIFPFQLSFNHWQYAVFVQR